MIIIKEPTQMTRMLAAASGTQRQRELKVPMECSLALSLGVVVSIDSKILNKPWQATEFNSKARPPHPNNRWISKAMEMRALQDPRHEPRLRQPIAISNKRKVRNKTNKFMGSTQQQELEQALLSAVQVHEEAVVALISVTVFQNQWNRHLCRITHAKNQD